MIKFSKKSAFSLVESLISLMLLTLVVMLTLSVITRKKTNLSAKSTVSGMYACWKESNDSEDATHMTYSGNVRVNDEDDEDDEPSTDGDCVFNMDRRIKKYHIIAVGSRNDKVDGQIQINDYIPPSGQNDEEMKLKIKLGKIKNERGLNGNGGITTVTNNLDDSEIIRALGGIEKTASELVPGNIKKNCKFTKECYPNSNSCYCPRYVCSSVDSENDELRKRGKNPYQTSFKIKEIKDENISEEVYSFDLEDLKIDEGGSQAHRYVYEPIANKTVKIKVTEEDSSLKAKETEISDSQFVRFLKMIPSSMQNGLTDDLLRYYQNPNDENGNKDKNGVVLIIW